MHTLRHNWQRLTLMDFMEWLRKEAQNFIGLYKKSEGHEKLRSPNSESKTEEAVKPKVATKMFANNSKVSVCK